MHHAFVIEADEESGIRTARAWLTEHLRMQIAGNPDVLVLRYGLLSVDDARSIAGAASGAPFSGEHKAVIIAAHRAYHEAQNSLLKLFEEPPKGTYLFLILPALGGLLPTLRSRVVELKAEGKKAPISKETEEFVKAAKEKRSAIIKRLTSGRDEEERRENREEAVSLLNGIEEALYRGGVEKQAAALRDISILRNYLHDRSAPVKMLLEHLSLVLPRNLL